MRRPSGSTVCLSLLACASLAMASPAQARHVSLPQNGAIAFYSNAEDGVSDNVAFTVAPNGTHLRQLLSARASHPHWSPDGTEIAIDAEFDSQIAPSAVIINARTGTIRELTGTLGRVCDTWSPDGRRLACHGDSDDPATAGIVTIRSSDGGGVRRVTSFSSYPGEFSPDGRRLSLVGPDANGDLRIFVVGVDGSQLSALTPAGMPLSDDDEGSWSPDGRWIAFSARSSENNRFSIWLMHPDGSSLHQLQVPGCGGTFDDPQSAGCLNPDWSPDGRRLAFDRNFAAAGLRNIYTVDPNGTHLKQVTFGTALDDQEPDWGVRPARQG